MVLLGLYLIAVFDCADQCQASTQQNHRKLLDTVYRLDRAPAPLLRVRQGGMAPRTMPKVLHVTSRWRSSIILHEGPDSTIGNINFIQSFHALGEMTENFVNVQWGFEGVRSKPCCGLQKIIYFPLNVHFKCPTVWKWSTTESLRVAAMRSLFTIWGPAPRGAREY